MNINFKLIRDSITSIPSIEVENPERLLIIQAHHLSKVKYILLYIHLCSLIHVYTPCSMEQFAVEVT